MLSILKVILIAFLVLIDISCIYCSFKKKPAYPYFVWFIVTSLSIIFLIWLRLLVYSLIISIQNVSRGT